MNDESDLDALTQRARAAATEKKHKDAARAEAAARAKQHPPRYPGDDELEQAVLSKAISSLREILGHSTEPSDWTARIVSVPYYPKGYHAANIRRGVAKIVILGVEIETNPNADDRLYIDLKWESTNWDGAYTPRGYKPLTLPSFGEALERLEWIKRHPPDPLWEPP